MKYIIGGLILLITLKSYGQQIVTSENRQGQLRFDSCNFAPFVIDDGKLGVAFRYKGGLSKYFDNALQAKRNLIVGDIFIQLLIDKTGEACCKSIFSHSTMGIDVLNSLGLDSLVRVMPKWVPAKMDGVKWNSSVLLQIKRIEGARGRITVEYVYLQPGQIKKEVFRGNPIHPQLF